MKFLKVASILLFVFLSLGLEGKTLNWNRGRGYRPFQYATTTGIYIDNPTDTLRYDYFKLDNPTYEFDLKFREKNYTGHPGKKYSYKTSDGKILKENAPHWGFFITTFRDTLVYEVRRVEKFSQIESNAELELTLYSLANNQNQKVSILKNINPYTGENIWQLVKNGNELILNAGNNGLTKILGINFNREITGFGFFSGWASSMLFSDIILRVSDNATPSLITSVDNLEERFSNSKDPMEGYWIIFDREIEESLIKLGGDYKLACVKDGTGYIFLYIDGANVNRKEWHPGDEKIRLTFTPFEGIYNVTWTDAMKDKMSQDIKAQEGEGNTLLIQFPYQSSRIRLRKLPQ